MCGCFWDKRTEGTGVRAPTNEKYGFSLVNFVFGLQSSSRWSEPLRASHHKITGGTQSAPRSEPKVENVRRTSMQMKVFMLHANANKTKIPTIQSDSGQKEAMSDARVISQQSRVFTLPRPHSRTKVLHHGTLFSHLGFVNVQKSSSLLSLSATQHSRVVLFLNFYQEPADWQHKEWSPATFFFRFGLIVFVFGRLFNKEI